VTAAELSDPASTAMSPTASAKAMLEWAYAVAYPTSGHRTAELPIWPHR